MDQESTNAARLFERAIAFLSAPAVPALLRAFDQLGIQSDLIAEILGIDAQTVLGWRSAQTEIPEDQRVTLLAYLSLLLPWLYAAEGHLAGQGSPYPFWQQRTQAARQLFEIETRAAPLLARRARALADRMDIAARQEALRAVSECGQRTSRIPTGD